MTDIEHTHQSPALSSVAAGLRLAADCLATSRFCPSEADEAREYAAVAMAGLSPDLVAQVERALRCGDHRRLDELANALEPPGAPTPEPKTRRPQLELDGGDLACLGMRRDSDSDFFAEIRREGQAELMRALGADCFKPTADPSPAKPRRPRKRSLARIITKAKQLGVDVTIEPDGTATFRTGNSTTTAADSPQTDFDEWIAKHAH